ncbi:glycerophosphoryl diester phosphodiesterase [Propionibacterium cyclohexanicum]|uniref:Glycerophosphoryl diester phosphodiesterase n=2 Tax=Propionibacterium cyclohexanicum TaxID=64702 RepID=A0A1H9RM16_9ACTN|nr:glycerophosphoryl diester phosphodiesterase [Propionibacterium cyclohexanicum]
MEAVHPFYLNLMAPGVLSGFQQRGIAVRAWTVNDPAVWRQLFAAQVDVIITDDPARALAERAGQLHGGGS